MIKTILAHIQKNMDSPWDESAYSVEPDLVAIIKWYYYERLKWCGCGRPGEAMRAIAKYLEDRQENRLHTDDDSLILCLAYELDRAGFTDHGSSIYGCWLTDDGKYFLWAIKEADKQGVLDI